jgi:hypothetical protein
MKEMFLSSVKQNKTTNSDEAFPQPESRLQQLRHVLKSYSLLAKHRQAEQLFTDHVCKPYMTEYINDSYLDTNIQKLNGLYEKVLEFLDQNDEFLRIVSEIKQNSSSANNENSIVEADSSSNSFDFLLNSIWSTIGNCIDLDLNRLFSPADPDLFHRNFTQTFDFLSKFETKCLKYDRDFKRRLIDSQSYKYFVKKWPVQVYYQIRFQEIVSKFEEELLKIETHTITSQQSQNLDYYEQQFNLSISDFLCKQLEYCWSESDECFLKCLLSQFWKLNMQLVARYSHFFIDLFQSKIQSLSSNSLTTNSKSNENNNLDTTLNNLNNRPKTPTDDLTQRHNLNGLYSTNSAKVNDLDLCVMLISDVNKLYSTKVRCLFFQFLNGQ